MAPPNVTWQSIIQQAMVSADVLKQSEVVRNVQNILQTNVSVCSSLGTPFLSQMRIIYVDMLTMYK
jgi:exportin-1